MKLLFPIFASLMLQYQVNTELWNLPKCLMGFGKCKNSCSGDEKEIQKCKKRKCCIGPKVIKLITMYLRHEIPHIPELENETMLIGYVDSNVKQRKYILSDPFNMESTSLPPSNNSVVLSSATPVNATGHITHAASATERDTKQSREPAHVSAPPAPP
uniref:Beta-defensin 129 n=1 Tax=Sciurus vulgaris TaxID=55149 RepID=A0A8D2CKE8_SCIVU